MMSSPSSGFVPAATPPPGVTPDFDHVDNVWHTVNIVNTYICLGLMVVFAAIRFYVKFGIKRDYMLPEDYFFSVAFVITVFFAVCIILLIHYGEGFHVWDLSQDTFKEFLKWLYISAVVYIPAAYTTKVTILLLIARVFAVKERTAKGLRCFIVCLAIAYLPVQITKMAVCNPISAYWNMTSKVGVTGKNPYCLNQTHLFIVDITIAMVTDFLILVLPIPLAMSMQTLHMRQKLKIIFLLSAGGVATATTVYRMVKIVQFLRSRDPTRDFTILSIFTLLELAIGVICACLPCVNVFVRTLQSRSSGALRNPNVPRTGPRRVKNAQGEASTDLTTLWQLSRASKGTMTSVQAGPYGEARDNSRGSTMVHAEKNEGPPRRGLGSETDLAIWMPCRDSIENCVSETQANTIGRQNDEEARGH